MSERLGFRRRERKQLKRCEHPNPQVIAEWQFYGVRVECPACGATARLTQEDVANQLGSHPADRGELRRRLPTRIARAA